MPKTVSGCIHIGNAIFLNDVGHCLSIVDRQFCEMKIQIVMKIAKR